MQLATENSDAHATGQVNSSRAAIRSSMRLHVVWPNCILLRSACMFASPLHSDFQTSRVLVRAQARRRVRGLPEFVSVTNSALGTTNCSMLGQPLIGYNVIALGCQYFTLKSCAKARMHCPSKTRQMEVGRGENHGGKYFPRSRSPAEASPIRQGGASRLSSCFLPRVHSPVRIVRRLSPYQSSASSDAFRRTSRRCRQFFSTTEYQQRNALLRSGI